MHKLLPLLLLVGCASQSPENAAADGERAAELASLKASPEYAKAEQFDRFLRGQLSSEELAALKQTCNKSPKENPFCPSYRLAKQILKQAEDSRRVAIPPEPKIIVGATFTITGKKIQGFRSLRREKIPVLLKGLESLPQETLRTIARIALAENKCPNHVAITVAATLEDYLPDQVSAKEIAKLYEHGGRCAANGSADKEHFLTRAALFHLMAENPQESARILKKVRPADAFSGRSLYWLYRSRKLLKDEAGAEQVRARLLRQFPFSFHATLIEHLSSEKPVEAKTPPAVNRSTRSPKANAFVEQVELLNHLGFESAATFLADFTMGRFSGLETGLRIHLAELASPKLRVISLSDLLLRKPSLISQKTLELAYPKPYFDYFERQSGQTDPLLLLAIARKESQFDPLAVSSANAQGLLQIQPATAQKLSGENPNLLDPEKNIMLGAKYVKELQSRLGQLTLVLAAYNAGEEPVGRWQKRYRTTDPILFMDLIPYRETRDYVGYVLANYHWYYRVHASNGKDPFQSLVPEIAVSK